MKPATPRPPLFAFGERLPGFEVPVLNERAVRAAAGLLFLFAMVSFMNAWLLGDFGPTRLFVPVFLADFLIRLLVNPRYAPSLIVGQWLVRKQQPEYVGAAQKRFAWAIGLALALLMFYLVVLRQVIGPLNLIVCASCLTLLFFESAFGICIGCTLYNWLRPEQARHCPGQVCDYQPAPGAGGSWAQGLLVLVFVVGVIAAAPGVLKSQNRAGAAAAASAAAAPAPAMSASDAAEAERCKVPDFAKAMGHEEKWKLHNNCR